jgi:hypothetical protein
VQGREITEHKLEGYDETVGERGKHVQRPLCSRASTMFSQHHESGLMFDLTASCNAHKDRVRPIPLIPFAYRLDTIQTGRGGHYI